MRKTPVIGFVLAAFGWIAGTGSFAETPGMPAPIRAMQAELMRNFKALQKEPVAPYYISYAIDEVRTQAVAGSFGAIITRNDETAATLRIGLRVGSPKLDNYHELRSQNALTLLTARAGGSVRTPLGERPEALTRILWRETDKAYKNAVETFAKVKSEQNISVAAEDQSEDFSKREPHQSLRSTAAPAVDMNAWAERVRKFSALFKSNPSITECQALFRAELHRKSFVDTEGTVLAEPENHMWLYVRGNVRAEDGMELPLILSYFGFKDKDFPSDAQILSDIKTMIRNLEQLRHAPVIDPYTGPAILAGKASGVFFHEILGHRLEGARLKSEREGQTFKKKVGEPILPDFISIKFDPTLRAFQGKALAGAFEYDAEGTRAEKVVSVQDGVLRDFLMGRTPVDKFPRSNGHARAQAGMNPTTRQSNLIVESRKMLEERVLRKMLIEECRKQNKPYGLLFTEITGGSTVTSRSAANVFNVIPLMVYRIYPDGRPDELVRGVDLIGTPLTTFGKILATGADMEIFNGNCGAESGSLPVSAVAPSILIGEIEVQKKAKSQEKAPILPPPAKAAGPSTGGGQ